MSDALLQAAHVSSVPPVGASDPGEPLWRPVRAHFGIRAFGVNVWEARSAGDPVIELHDEISNGTAAHEELYFVASGHATFTAGNEEIDAPAGTLVFVRDPAVARSAIAREAGTTVLAVGAAPGRAFSVSPWECKHLT